MMEGNTEENSILALALIRNANEECRACQQLRPKQEEARKAVNDCVLALQIAKDNYDSITDSIGEKLTGINEIREAYRFFVGKEMQRYPENY